ncbi:MAG: hypothetical protein IMF19_12080 [Proteobacteria bacterium]|nr:hypothetical protein [Pseudomonadota bacterium]
MKAREPEVWIRDLHIRVERCEGPSMPRVPEKQASRETMKELKRGVIETIENYLGELYRLKKVEGKGKLEVEFDFE